MVKEASPKNMVFVGRFTTVIFVVIGAFIAFFLKDFPQGIFTFIQEFQGFISPGILGAFLFGFIFKRAPRKAGISALVGSLLIYTFLLLCFSGYEPFLLHTQGDGQGHRRGAP